MPANMKVDEIQYKFVFKMKLVKINVSKCHLDKTSSFLNH